MEVGIGSAIRGMHAVKPFDVVNAQWLYPDGVAAVRIGQSLRVPVVLTALGSDVNVCMREPAKWKQVIESLEGAAAITTVSAALKDRLVAGGASPEKVKPILNGADHSVFHVRAAKACREDLGIATEGKVVLYVGRLVEIKGLEHLIAAAAKLARMRADFTICLVGDGPLRERLQADAGARGLEARVRFMGPRPHAEIATWMGACDVFCLPSLDEGCPNVVLEALFSGRPVVASRVGGIPEMVGPSNGLLPASADPDGLADALQGALTRAWNAESIRDGVMHLTWEAAASAYHDVFASACGKVDS
jgi:glycosyltransferase involved in cell wall biosynthesis